ncbi:hypothetical protein GTP46_29160 [Duganella sp. FT135W]|uniref:Uncharacterized protein n=1 Tax=Duganella flavida TaxID=2692175 RepID=A0A6L8KH85_9BURK|nr:hypothetical protein [Duganella flavida]MYM26686.1 hypothetical protein [Duganella flavida]
MKITCGTDAGQESDESLAARYEITFDGKRYTFREYKYDRFGDALRYAAMTHAKQGFLQDKAFQPLWLAAYSPTAEDEAIMRLHGIAYVEGHYLYGS